MTGRPWITCHLDQSLWPQEQDCLRWQFPIRASHVGVGGKGRAHHKQGRWTVPPIINVSLKCPLLYLWTPSPFWSHLRGLEAFSTLPTPAQALWEFGRGPWVKAKQRTREGCTEWTMFTSLPYISQVCFRETPGWYWYVQDRNSYPLTLLKLQSLQGNQFTGSDWCLSGMIFLKLIQASDSGSCPCSWHASSVPNYSLFPILSPSGGTRRRGRWDELSCLFFSQNIASVDLL